MDFNSFGGLHNKLDGVRHCLEMAQIFAPDDISYLEYPSYAFYHIFLRKVWVCIFVRENVCCRRFGAANNESGLCCGCALTMGIIPVPACTDSTAAMRCQLCLSMYKKGLIMCSIRRRWSLEYSNTHHQDWLGSRTTAKHTVSRDHWGEKPSGYTKTRNNLFS